jgi:Zn ribbon nucleic-acid-binding protein
MSYSFTGLGIIASFLALVVFAFIRLLISPADQFGLDALYYWGFTLLFIDIFLVGQSYQWKQVPVKHTIAENVCPSCGSGNTARTGFQLKVQRRLCKDCGRNFKDTPTSRNYVRYVQPTRASKGKGK